MSDLRPTLFLAQLSNLLAGNISIVHGVTGSSRTFMGEEAAGVDAVRVAAARIQAGQSDIGLVGGAQNSERQDQILVYDSGGHALRAPFAPVFERAAHGGMALGSLGAFLVLEAAEHAKRRGVSAFGKLSIVLSDQTRRRPGDITATLERMWRKLQPSLAGGHVAIVSGATGSAPATTEELDFLRAHADIPMRATGSLIGHGVEAQFPMNLALATLALRQRRLYAPAHGSPDELDTSDALTQIIVTGVGHWRGEGIALVEAAH